MITKGNKKVVGVFKGNVPITAIYKGSHLVFGGSVVPDDDWNINAYWDGAASSMGFDLIINNANVRFAPVNSGENKFKLKDYFSGLITQISLGMPSPFVKKITLKDIDVSRVTNLSTFYSSLSLSELNLTNLDFNSGDNSSAYSTIFSPSYNAQENIMINIRLENVSFPNLTKGYLFSGTGLKEVYLKNVTINENFDFNKIFFFSSTDAINLTKIVADKEIMDKINETSNKGGLDDLWDSIDKYYYNENGEEVKYGDGIGGGREDDDILE